jgi:hypothetical protein
MISEIDIWRAATLMLKRNGERALEESGARVESSHRPAITTAWPCGADLGRGRQLVYTTSPGPVH